MVDRCNDSKIDSVCEINTGKKFDVIFYTPSDPNDALTEEQLLKVKKNLGGKLVVVWWDYDDSDDKNVYIEFEKMTLKVADLIIDPGNITKTRKMKSKIYPYFKHVNTEKIHVLPTPVDQKIFFPRKKTIDIALFGSNVGMRDIWIKSLKKHFPNSFVHVGGVAINKKAISMPVYAEMSGSSRIIVNTQTFSFMSQCKGKVREALASSALLLEQECSDTREFFEGNDFIKFFSTEKEMIDLAEYYLKNPREATLLADRAHEWYMANWSSVPWAKKVLSALI
jgi:hypothetical protein